MATPSFAEVLQEQMNAYGPKPDRTVRRPAPWQDMASAWRRVEINASQRPVPKGPETFNGQEIPHCFRVLGVPPSASLAELKRAFRARALQTHPDHHSGGHEAFLSLVRAYENACDHLVQAA